ncbi:MAG: DUF488 family protein [Saccharofermentanales bacterium]
MIKNEKPSDIMNHVADSAVKDTLVLTIGHSTRELQEFVHLLQENNAECVVDVRTIPGSRHNPQYNKETLAAGLNKANIEYLHMSGLGGLRHTKSDSPNTGWKNKSFRGYADYMLTDDFPKYLNELIELSRKKLVAIMCAEAVPWRCHRSLIGDALLIRGINVEHIIGAGRRQPHQLTPFAKIEGKKIIYPPEDFIE